MAKKLGRIGGLADDGKRLLGDGRCGGVCFFVEKGGGLEEGGLEIDPDGRAADYFLVLFGCLFPPLFFVRSLRVLGGRFGPQWLHLGPFGSLLGHFWVTFWRLVGPLVFDTPLQR